MIDFRYHLVSLISVFLALAVGVVLGAGPLQNSLGTALNDQVTSLRADRNALQSQLEQTEGAVNDRDSYITELASSVLPGTLDGKKVAIVTLPDAENDDVDAATTELQAAGATVDGRLRLTDAWTDEGRATFRSTYSGQFAGYLDSPSSEGGNAVLGQGLVSGLTTDGEKATALMDLLTATDQPLATVDSKPSGKVDMVLVIGPRDAATDSSADAAAKATAAATAADENDAWSQALSGAASEGTVVVEGAAQSSTGLVAALRSGDVKVTTIDSVGQVTAAVSAPLALASTASGTVASYGFDDGASAVLPPTGK